MPLNQILGGRLAEAYLEKPDVYASTCYAVHSSMADLVVLISNVLKVLIKNVEKSIFGYWFLSTRLTLKIPREHITLLDNSDDRINFSGNR